MKYFTFLIILASISISCSESFTPKPKAYPKIIFPEKAYKKFVVEDCPFIFEMPKYGKILSNKTFFGELPDSPCWVDVTFEDFAGTIHLSYKEVDDEKNAIGILMDDAHKMTFKHTIKAEYIEEKRIQGRKDDVNGIFYDVGGDAASALQFYLTDYENHFVRGALYFQTTPNVDSLAPVIDFFRVDLLHMFDTFEWDDSEN